MSDCIFCAIVAGTADSSTGYADEHVVAFMDIQPVTPGHLLVIPRDHLPSLADVPPSMAGHIFTVGQRLAASLRRSGCPAKGSTCSLLTGRRHFRRSSTSTCTYSKDTW